MFDKLTYQLRQLKLHDIANAFERQNGQPSTYDDLSFTERFQLLIDSEATERDGRKQDRLIKAAKFKISANAADIDYQHPRALK
jgi:DNA replication protein DnaC